MDILDKWKDIMPADELEVYRNGGFGGKFGFGERAALINVDTHNLFVDPRYAYCHAEMPALIDALTALTETFRSIELPIYYVRRDDWSLPAKAGARNFLFSNMKDAEDSLGIKDPFADEWPESYAPRAQDVIVYKNKPSAFFATPLSAWLRYDRVDTLVICGIATSGCVRATVCDAFSNNFRVILPEEACGDRSPTAHRMNLFDMDMKYADLEKQDDVISTLQSLYG